VNPDPTILRLKNILICCDLSSTTLSLYPYAEKLLQHFEAELHIVHAMQTPVKEDIIDPTMAPYAEVQNKLQYQLHEQLRHLMPMTLQKNPAVTTAVIPGNPSDSLHDYANKHGIDLILVGVRPRGSIQKVLIGSTTESMIRHAPCNILTIPCKEIKVEPHV
jgi:universal stress protein A